MKFTSSVDVFNELTGGTTDLVPITPDDSCIRHLSRVLRMTTIVTAASVNIFIKICVTLKFFYDIRTEKLNLCFQDSDAPSNNGILPAKNYCITGIDIVSKVFHLSIENCEKIPILLKVHVADGSTFTLVKMRLSPNMPPYNGAWGSIE